MDYKKLIKVEPYWNVNTTITTNIFIIFIIKVEPYWNVNITSKASTLKTKEIKVEPYWNVNSYVWQET